MANLDAQIVAEADTATARMAGFWLRFLAFIVDLIPIAAINLVTNLAITGDAARERAGTNGSIAGVVGILLIWLYFALFESSRLQGTPGKLAVGLAVTDLDNRRIGFGRATGRYFAKILSYLTLLIGFFMAGWTRKKQALHDKLADTLVARRPGRWAPSKGDRAGIVLGTKVCPECAATVKAAARACRFCGYQFDKTCPECAERVNASAKTCRFCGHRFEADAG